MAGNCWKQRERCVRRPPKPKVACSNLAGRKSPESGTCGGPRNASADTVSRRGKLGAIGALVVAALLASTGASAEPVGPPAPSAQPCGAASDGLPPCPPRPEPRPVRLWPRLAFYGGLACADLISTEMFLARGLEEGNPLMRNRGVRAVSHAAATAGFAVLDRHLDRKGHRRALWAVRGVLGVGTGIIVARNLRAYSARDRKD